MREYLTNIGFAYASAAMGGAGLGRLPLDRAARWRINSDFLPRIDFLPV
jgi:hypothetical protein